LLECHFYLLGSWNGLGSLSKCSTSPWRRAECARTTVKCSHLSTETRAGCPQSFVLPRLVAPTLQESSFPANSHHYPPTYNTDKTQNHKGECYHIHGSSRYLVLEQLFCNSIEKSTFPSFHSV